MTRRVRTLASSWRPVAYRPLLARRLGQEGFPTPGALEPQSEFNKARQEILRLLPYLSTQSQNEYSGRLRECETMGSVSGLTCVWKVLREIQGKIGEILPEMPPAPPGPRTLMTTTELLVALGGIASVIAGFNTRGDLGKGLIGAGSAAAGISIYSMATRA